METNRKSYTDNKFFLTLAVISAVLAIGSVKFTRSDYARTKIDKQVSQVNKPVAPAETTGTAFR